MNSYLPVSFSLGLGLVSKVLVSISVSSEIFYRDLVSVSVSAKKHGLAAALVILQIVIYKIVHLNFKIHSNQTFRQLNSKNKKTIFKKEQTNIVSEIVRIDEKSPLKENRKQAHR